MFPVVPTYEFLVESELSGIRVDSFLIKHLRNYNPWRMQRIARAGGVAINGVPAQQTDRVFRGQCVRVRLLEPPDKLLDAEEIDVPILYEDPWMMVVNKPAGLVVHPVGALQGKTLAGALQHRLDQHNVRGILRPGFVHRLDRETSGALVVALTHRPHVTLAAAFEHGRVSKTYLALVEGQVAESSGTLSWPIGRARTGRHVLMSCRADAIDRKPAKTHFEVVQRFADCTLVKAKPRTGRNHQIRVHFAQFGHPVVGDEFYLTNGRFRPFHSDPDESREVETGLPIRRHALHALQLGLPHPVTGVWMEFTAPLPEDFVELFKQLGWPCSLVP